MSGPGGAAGGGGDATSRAACCPPTLLPPGSQTHARTPPLTLATLAAGCAVGYGYRYSPKTCNKCPKGQLDCDEDLGATSMWRQNAFMLG